MVLAPAGRRGSHVKATDLLLLERDRDPVHSRDLVLCLCLPSLYICHTLFAYDNPNAYNNHLRPHLWSSPSPSPFSHSDHHDDLCDDDHDPCLYPDPCLCRRRTSIWGAFGHCAWLATETVVSGEKVLPSYLDYPVNMTYPFEPC